MSAPYPGRRTRLTHPTRRRTRLASRATADHGAAQLLNQLRVIDALPDVSGYDRSCQVSKGVAQAWPPRSQSQAVADLIRVAIQLPASE